MMSVLFLWIVQSASAADLVVGAGATGSFTCEAGQPVMVTGSTLTVTFNGDCGPLQVVGSANKVTIDGVSSIRVEGSNNTVTWKRSLATGSELPIAKVGTKNKVKKAS